MSCMMRTARKECNGQSKLLQKYSLKGNGYVPVENSFSIIDHPSNEIASLSPQPPVNVIRNVNMTYPRLNFCMDQWTGEKCYDSSGFKYIRTKPTTGKLTSNQKSRSLF